VFVVGEEEGEGGEILSFGQWGLDGVSGNGFVDLLYIIFKRITIWIKFSVLTQLQTDIHCT
jgi:hypothetical protein